MATINVTLRIVRKYFESNPAWTTWEQMQINKIEFWVTNLTGDNLTRVDVPITGPVTSDFISAAVTLNQNTDYLVRAVAFSPFHPSGVQSTQVQFNTGDPVAYHNFETLILNRTTLAPIPGATVIFGVGTLDITRTSRHDGMVWVQRIPAGTYDIRVSMAGFTTLDTTWVAGGATRPSILLSPLP